MKVHCRRVAILVGTETVEDRLRSGRRLANIYGQSRTPSPDNRSVCAPSRRPDGVVRREGNSRGYVVASIDEACLGAVRIEEGHAGFAVPAFSPRERDYYGPVRVGSGPVNRSRISIRSQGRRLLQENAIRSPDRESVRSRPATRDVPNLEHVTFVEDRNRPW